MIDSGRCNHEDQWQLTGNTVAESVTYRCANARAKTTLVEHAIHRDGWMKWKRKARATDGHRNIQEEIGRRKTFRYYAAYASVMTGRRASALTYAAAHAYKHAGHRPCYSGGCKLLTKSLSEGKNWDSWLYFNWSKNAVVVIVNC